MARKNAGEKFAFGVDFQEAVLHYTVQDRHGYKALPLYEDSYFDLIPHAFIAFALKRYYKKRKRVPTKVVLKELLRELYDHRDYKKDLTEDLKDEIGGLVDKFYSSLLADGDDILEKVIKFAQYVEFKAQLESADLNDFDSYLKVQKGIQKALSIGNMADDHHGMMLVAGVEGRIAGRNSEDAGTKMPWWQMNRAHNGGLLPKHSLIMLMSEAKRFKTGGLINLGRALMGHRKRGIYFDLENGESAIGDRADQSILKINKEALLSGEYDQKLFKQMRKYKRLKSELVVLRLNSLSTTADDMQKHIDWYAQELGIKFDYALVDYGDLMAALSGKKDDTERISDAFLDLKNLAKVNDFDFIATASHVNREGGKARRGTVYQAGDVAKCIDKIRHLDVCWGLQENDDEKAAGVLRMQIVEQRHGPPDAMMMFWMNIETQTLKEFTRSEVAAYREQLKGSPEESEEKRKKRKEKTSDL